MGARLGLVLATLVAGSGSAFAQPADPYAPAPPGPPKPPGPAGPADPYGPLAPPSGPAPAMPTPAPSDPVLAEQVAQSLVARAQELLDAKVYLDAKQLAVEAMVQSPKGTSAEHARMIIKLVNQQLGIRDEVPVEVRPEPPVVAPISDPTARTPKLPPVTGPIEGEPSPDLVANVHGAIFGGVIGAMIGTLVSDDGQKQAGGAVAIGVGGALAGALIVPRIVDKLDWSEAQVRTAGSGSVWGGVIGAFVGDIGTGLQGTSGRQVMVGAGLGSAIGALAGSGLASRNKLTRGDVALVDTLAGIGTVGGLTLGMLMQPAQSEAYSLNAVLGAAGGVAIGLVAGPQTNTTPRRMLRVAGGAALGAAIPFLILAAAGDTVTSERTVGLLSSGGLVIGAYLGFRYTRTMDEGLDTLDGKKLTAPDDAPPAALTRSSSGQWGFGGLALQPLSRQLDNRQRGTGVTVFGASF